jgi:hypothetical protein
MRILLELEVSSGGRLTGVATALSDVEKPADGRRFDGNLELLACLEQLLETPLPAADRHVTDERTPS